VWDAPAGCPSREAFVQRVRAMATSPLADDIDIHARIHVEPEGARWSARVAIDASDAGSERSFEGASCAAVADAAALMVGLALTSAPPPSAPPGTPAVPAGGAAVEEAAAHPPVATRAASIEVQPAAPAPHDAVSSRSLVFRPSLRASAIVDFGTMPAAGPGATVGASWRVGLFEASVDAAAFAGERGAVAGSTSGASVALASASADACLAVPLRDRVVMVPCAGMALERLAADGFGAASRFDAAQPVVVLAAALGEVGLEWSPLRWLALRVAARALAPLSRPTFVVHGPGGGDVYRPAFAALEPSAGVVLFLDK
jgi:hypothetical protein